MKIVYMGTPEFAVAPLKALFAKGHDIALVVTKPDRPKDRGKKMQSCPVKLAALEMGLKVESPETLKENKAFEELIISEAPDIIITAAYGKLLPKSILDIPRLGCVNLHGSLLPAYRGAAPVQRAIMNLEKKTGITLMYMAEGMDTGDMIAKSEVLIEEKTSEELFSELSQKAAELITEQLPLIESGKAARIPQDESLASYAPMISKEECVLDYKKSPETLCGVIRAIGGATEYKGEKMKVHMAKALSDASDKPAGTVISADKNGIGVSAGGRVISFTKVQLPGKKAMDVQAFLLGNKIEIGTVLG